MALQLFDPGALFGVLGTALLVITCALAVAFTWRASVVRTWRDTAEGERARREQLEKDVAEQRESKHTALNELAALRMRTDLTPVLEALVRGNTEIAAFHKAFVERGSLFKELELAIRQSEERLTTQMGALATTQHSLAVTVERLAARVEHFHPDP